MNHLCLLPWDLGGLLAFHLEDLLSLWKARGTSDCSSLERDLLKSSFLTSSERGTGILIF
jgi:hypothetical protein